MGERAHDVHGASLRIAVQAHVAFAVREAAGLHGAEFALAQGGEPGRESFIAGKREDQSLHECRVRLFRVEGNRRGRQRPRATPQGVAAF